MGDSDLRRVIVGAGLALAVLLGLLTPVEQAAAVPPTGSVSGAVTVDPGGDPIAGATVYMWNIATLDDYTTFTTGDGHYTFTGIPAGTFNVHFEAPGFVDEYWDDKQELGIYDPVVVTASAVSGIDAALVPAAVVSGTVTDGVDPLPDATVNAYTADGSWIEAKFVNPDGTYAFALAAGTYLISAYASGYPAEYFDNVYTIDAAAPVVTTPAAPATGVDFSLELGGTMSGTVTNMSGDPLANIRVTMFPHGSNESLATTFTDATGAYRTFVPLPVGQYDVRFADMNIGAYASEWYHDAFLRPAALPVIVTGGNESTGIDAKLDLTSAVAGVLEGTVTGPGGPVANTDIAVVDPFALYSGTLAVGTTGPDGSYGIEGVPPGMWRVVADPDPPLAPQYFDGAYTKGDADLVAFLPLGTSSADFTLDIGGSISGTVTAPGGSPVANAGVSVFGGLANDFAGSFGYTTADGSFAIDGLAPGAYSVCFEGPDGVDLLDECFDDIHGAVESTPVPVTLAADTPGIDAQLDYGASISGVVTDSHGDPVEGATVFANDGVTYRSTKTSWDGTYLVRGLEAGSDDVEAAPPDGVLLMGEHYPDAVTVTQGANTSGIDFELAPSAGISGRVTRTNGDPLTGVRIDVLDSSVYLGSGVVTDENGEYAVVGLPAGALQVVFTPPLGSGYLAECYDDKPLPCASPTLVNTTVGVFAPGIDASLAVDPAVSLPGTPTAVTATPGDGQASVSWTAPTSDGGSAIAGYEATATPGGASCSTTGATTCVVAGLANGTPYTFTVIATNALGDGPASIASAPVTPEGPASECGPLPAPGPFPDVPGTHPFCADIEWLADLGVTGGFPDGTFRPANDITRQSMAAFLYRYAGSPAFTPPATPSFPDVPTTHPFFKEIEWLAETGITGGFPDGTFRPAQPITRQSVAAFFYRLAGKPAFTPPATPSFPDVPTTHPFFEEIEWLADSGITGGFADGTFRPGSVVTRQAFAAFLHRFDTSGL